MPVSTDTVRELRGLRLSYFHADFKEGMGDEECMKISRKQPGKRVESACFRRKELHRFADSDFFNSHVPRICEQLYGLDTQPGRMNVMHVIQEGLEDLHRYPPAIPETKDQMLDRFARQGAIINVNGQKLND